MASGSDPSTGFGGLGAALDQLAGTSTSRSAFGGAVLNPLMLNPLSEGASADLHNGMPVAPNAALNQFLFNQLLQQQQQRRATQLPGPSGIFGASAGSLPMYQNGFGGSRPSLPNITQPQFGGFHSFFQASTNSLAAAQHHQHPLGSLEHMNPTSSTNPVAEPDKNNVDERQKLLNFYLLQKALLGQQQQNSASLNAPLPNLPVQQPSTSKNVPLIAQALPKPQPNIFSLFNRSEILPASLPSTSQAVADDEIDVDVVAESPQKEPDLPSGPVRIECHSPGLPTQPYFPTHFLRGTQIQVGKDATRLVEALELEDFRSVAAIASTVHELQLRRGIVKAFEVSAESPQVTISFQVEAKTESGATEISLCELKVPVEYPFFESAKKWSSYKPEKTRNLYGIAAKQLEVGDECLVLTAFEEDPQPLDDGFDENGDDLNEHMDAVEPLPPRPPPKLAHRRQSQVAVPGESIGRIPEDVEMDDHVVI